MPIVRNMSFFYILEQQLTSQLTIFLADFRSKIQDSHYSDPTQESAFLIEYIVTCFPNLLKKVFWLICRIYRKKMRVNLPPYIVQVQVCFSTI